MLRKEGIRFFAATQAQRVISTTKFNLGDIFIGDKDKATDRYESTTHLAFLLITLVRGEYVDYWIASAHKEKGKTFP